MLASAAESGMLHTQGSTSASALYSLAGAPAAPEPAAARPRPQPLRRQQRVFSIDPPTARDLDDALSGAPPGLQRLFACLRACALMCGCQAHSTLPHMGGAARPACALHALARPPPRRPPLACPPLPPGNSPQWSRCPAAATAWACTLLTSPTLCSPERRWTGRRSSAAPQVGARGGAPQYPAMPCHRAPCSCRAAQHLHANIGILWPCRRPAHAPQLTPTHRHLPFFAFLSSCAPPCSLSGGPSDPHAAAPAVRGAV